MSVNNVTTTKKPVDSKGNLTAGLILVTIGLALLVFKWLSIEMIFPLTLAFVFIVAGIARRSAGLLIPGGIIGGVGLGIVAMESGRFAAQGGGVMLTAMAIGFLSIIVLSKLFSNETQLWPVFPGGALAVIGGLMLMGDRGLQLLEVLTSYWPLILVAVGLGILLKNLRVRG